MKTQEDNFKLLAECIYSEQVPKEDIFKLFRDNPGLEDYYRRIRNLSSER